MATVRVNPPPHPKPTSVVIVTGQKNFPERESITFREGRNGTLDAWFARKPASSADYGDRAIFSMSRDDARDLVCGLADMIGLEVVDHA